MRNKQGNDVLIYQLEPAFYDLLLYEVPSHVLVNGRREKVYKIGFPISY